MATSDEPIKLLKDFSETTSAASSFESKGCCCSAFLLRGFAKSEIKEHEVETDENYDFMAQYLAQFAGDLPRHSEVEDALSWVTLTYDLNPTWNLEHQARASIEGAGIRAFGRYCLDHFQPSPHARVLRAGMTLLTDIIRAKLTTTIN